MNTAAYHFSVFRIFFGVYLAIHFAMLVPHAVELFGVGGVLGDASMNPAPGLFPNPLNLNLADGVVAGVLWVLCVLALLFAAGVGRVWVSQVLWFGWTALFHRNQLIANPSLAYVGLLLVLCSLVPAGEPWAFGRGGRDPDWRMPVWVPRTAGILLAAGYTFSGVIKMSSASWVDGSAMAYLLENPLARPGFLRDVMLWLPDGILRGLTWCTLVAEVVYLPFALWKRSRFWIWLVLVVMHFGIIGVVDFADLSLGMLMVHLFVMEPKWLERFRSLRRPGVV